MGGSCRWCDDFTRGTLMGDASGLNGRLAGLAAAKAVDPPFEKKAPPRLIRGKVPKVRDSVEARLERVKADPGEWYLVWTWPARAGASMFQAKYRTRFAAAGFTLRAVQPSQTGTSELYARYDPPPAGA